MSRWITAPVLSEIPALLFRLSNEPANEEQAYPIPNAMEFESNIAEQQLNTREFLDNVEERLSAALLIPVLSVAVASGK